MVVSERAVQVAPNNLTDRITETLRQDIVSGKYAPGRQLPAGKDLGRRFGVSITVGARGLVAAQSRWLGGLASRQGCVRSERHEVTSFPVGAHQRRADAGRTYLRAAHGRRGSGSKPRGRAADRAGPQHDGEISQAHGAGPQAVRPSAGCRSRFPPYHCRGDAKSADRRFHEVFATASSRGDRAGAQYVREASPTEADAHREHVAIYEAIAAKDPRRARRSVRLVLSGSLKRLGEAAS